jgi:hypothetical protein
VSTPESPHVSDVPTPVAVSGPVVNAPESPGPITEEETQEQLEKVFLC